MSIFFVINLNSYRHCWYPTKSILMYPTKNILMYVMNLVANYMGRDHFPTTL
jgi:hypothetical protein